MPGWAGKILIGVEKMSHAVKNLRVEGRYEKEEPGGSAGGES